MLLLELERFSQIFPDVFKVNHNGTSTMCGTCSQSYQMLPTSLLLNSNKLTDTFHQFQKSLFWDNGLNQNSLLQF